MSKVVISLDGLQGANRRTLREKNVMKLLVLTFCLLAAVSQAGSTFAVDKTQRILLIGQAPDGHPPGTHEYRAAASLFAKMLAPMDRLQTMQVSGYRAVMKVRMG